ncbi:MAG: hypothetical protein HPY64_03090 [Anaerolineae bacterium]|nr:hypothetical protein [Anaerolineae bacterium]
MARPPIICSLVLVMAVIFLLTGCEGHSATATVTPLPTNTPDLPATETQQAFAVAQMSVAMTQTALAGAQQTVSAAQAAAAATLAALDAARADLHQTATAGVASLIATETAIALAVATLEAGEERLAARQTALAAAASSTGVAQTATAAYLATPAATPSPAVPITVEAWQEVTLPGIGVRAILPPGFVLVESGPDRAIFERATASGVPAIIAFNTDPGDLPGVVNFADPVAVLQAALDDPANADLFDVLQPATAYPGLRYPAAQARIRLPDSGQIVAYLALKVSADDWLFFSLAGAVEDVERWLPPIAPGILSTGRES